MCIGINFYLVLIHTYSLKQSKVYIKIKEFLNCVNSPTLLLITIFLFRLIHQGELIWLTKEVRLKKEEV
jgi:hypothetical protein